MTAEYFRLVQHKLLIAMLLCGILQAMTAEYFRLVECKLIVYGHVIVRYFANNDRGVFQISPVQLINGHVVVRYFAGHDNGTGEAPAGDAEAE